MTVAVLREIQRLVWIHSNDRACFGDEHIKLRACRGPATNNRWNCAYAEAMSLYIWAIYRPVFNQAGPMYLATAPTRVQIQPITAATCLLHHSVPCG